MDGCCVECGMKYDRKPTASIKQREYVNFIETNAIGIWFWNHSNFTMSRELNHTTDNTIKLVVNLQQSTSKCNRLVSINAKIWNQSIYTQCGPVDRFSQKFKVTILNLPIFVIHWAQTPRWDRRIQKSIQFCHGPLSNGFLNFWSTRTAPLSPICDVSESQKWLYRCKLAISLVLKLYKIDRICIDTNILTAGVKIQTNPNEKIANGHDMTNV